MLRWLAPILVGILAAGAGLFAGYTLWGSKAVQLEHVEQRLQSTGAELTSVREQKDDIEQRLQQVTKEQERLAQENEILRKQDTTQRLLGTPGAELPSLPPK
jgi:septation ring formation regulator EzrA